MASSSGSSPRNSSVKRSNAPETSHVQLVLRPATAAFSGPRVTLFAAREQPMTEHNPIPRRKFLSQASATAAALTIVPRYVLGRGFVPPSDMLNIAGIGVGGMGRANLTNLASQNIVALCDVDWGYAGKSLDRLDSDIDKLRTRIEAPPAEPPPGQPAAEFDREKAKTQLANMITLKTEHVPKAKRYNDYRQMLEQQKDIDAIVVATPD